MDEIDNDPTEIYQALSAWLTYMRSVEKYAASTVTGKLQEATRVTNWLNTMGLTSTREITTRLLSDFAVQNYSHLADRTHNLYLSHLRMYVKFLRERKMLGEDQSPETDLKPRRRPASRKVKAFIYPEDIEALSDKAAKWHLRDKYFLLFAFYGARRAGEVCALRWADIDTTSRPGYKYGMFRFRNNKIGGEIKRRPIDPLLLPHVLAWREEYEREIGRNIRQTDYAFPALAVGAGMSSGGARRALRLVPDKRVPYVSIRKSLRKAGVFGIHSARRGGLISLDQRFDLDAAQIMADHKTPEQTAGYLDMDLKAQELGDRFEAEQTKKNKKAAQKKLKKSKAAAKAAGLPNLKDRRVGGRRAS